MAAYNPNKKIKIEIRAHVDPTLDYEVWDIRDADKSKCISRKATEDDIMNVLSPGQYAEFKDGKFIALVRSHLLVDSFSYFY